MERSTIRKDDAAAMKSTISNPAVGFVQFNAKPVTYPGTLHQQFRQNLKPLPQQNQMMAARLQKNPFSVTNGSNPAALGQCVPLRAQNVHLGVRMMRPVLPLFSFVKQKTKKLNFGLN